MSDGDGRLERAAAGGWGHLPALTRDGLVHGFSCRDLDGPGGAADALAAALGIAGLERARLRQRHTAVSHLAPPGAQPEPPPVGDALLAEGAGVALMISTADCVPLVVSDHGSGALAVVHAGWRGTLAGILPSVVGELSRRFGTPRASLRIGVGPAIRHCCYEVGPDVVARFGRAWPTSERWLRPGPSGKPHLDLVAANREQAEAAGVPPPAFLDPAWCTRCRNDLFHSYRGEGPGSGRIVTLATRRLSPAGDPG